MAERNLIFGTKGARPQIGYAVFDLIGRPRCEYIPATGNLLDPNTGKIVGHAAPLRLLRTKTDSAFRQYRGARREPYHVTLPKQFVSQPRCTNEIAL